MIADDILELLVCPESKQPLHRSDPALLEHLKHEAVAGTLRTIDGAAVSVDFDDILVRQDRRIGYLVRGGIPVLLVDQGVSLNSRR